MVNSNSNEWDLIATGFSLGLLHVLAGPDHLSALAALSVGTSYKAFMLGFRWGIGHSTGLVVVAIIFIILKGDLDLRALGRYCDTFVGIFMIIIGWYGIISAFKSYHQKLGKRDSDLSPRLLKSSSDVGISMLETGSLLTLSGKYIGFNNTLNINNFNNEQANNDRSHLDDTMHDDRDNNYTSRITESTSFLSHSDVNESSSPRSRDYDHEHEHDNAVEWVASWCPFVDLHDPTTQRILSFSVGLLHGIAGPGGVLGVIPAVEMQRWTSSVLYLGSFILASTLSMGMFAALYGELTRRIGATAEIIELSLSIFSSAMSMLVGIVWLTLSLLGKLDRLFH